MERPRAVTVFGILNIAFGAIALMGGLLTIVSAKEIAANPGVAAMMSSPQYQAWYRILVPFGFALRAVLLAAGIGLLYMKTWARTTSVAGGVASIVIAIINSFVFLHYALPVMVEKASRIPGIAGTALRFGAYGSGFGSLLAMVYPSLLIYFLTRPQIKAAFDSYSTPPPLPP